MDFEHSFARVDYRLEIIDASTDQKIALLNGLKAICREDTEALNDLRDWLSGTIEENLEPLVETQTKPGRELVDEKRIGASLYQLEKVRCGKGACKSCPHGPYWYGYRRTGGKLKSWYVGKDLSKEISKVVGEED
jgi:hypothetical protein